MFRVIISRVLEDDHSTHYTTKAFLVITLNITPPRP
jgi:hypothetical protein